MTVAECPLLFAASPFYSVILGFFFFLYQWFPLFVPLGIRTNVVSATLVAGSFLILHYFSLLRFSFQKTSVDFPVLGGPKGLTFGLSFSKISRLHFSNPSFGCFPFCHFSQVGWFLPARLKDPQPPFFMILLPGFPEVLGRCSCIVGSQAFWSPFLHP